MDNIERRPFRVAILPTAVLLPICILAGSCGQSRASIGLAVVPDPIPVNSVLPCAGVFAQFPCSATAYLDAKLTVTVSTMNDIGGRGTIEVRAVDGASGQTLRDPQGTVSGDLDVLLGPHSSVSRPVEWKRPIRDGLPPQLAFVVTVQLTDSMGNHVLEEVTVREGTPRSW